MLYFCYQGHGQKGRQDVDDFEYPFESDPKALSRGAKAAWIRWWPRSGRKGYLDRIESGARTVPVGAPGARLG